MCSTYCRNNTYIRVRINSKVYIDDVLITRVNWHLKCRKGREDVSGAQSDLSLKTVNNPKHSDDAWSTRLYSNPACEKKTGVITREKNSRLWFYSKPLSWSLGSGHHRKRYHDGILFLAWGACTLYWKKPPIVEWFVLFYYSELKYILMAASRKRRYGSVVGFILLFQTY